VDVPVPRVAGAPQADCRIAQIVASPSMSRPIVQAPITRSISWSPWVGAHPSAAWPNYISQDKEDNDPPPEQRTTMSAAWSIMQEAMLACANIYRPEYILSEDLGILNYTSNPTKPRAKFTVTPQQMSMRRLPMTWFCEMASPHCQPQDTSQVDPFLWEQNWMTCPGHARLQHWHKHHHLHQEGSGTKDKSQGRYLWPHHMPRLT
jgi:hypothetical protein